MGLILLKRTKLIVLACIAIIGSCTSPNSDNKPFRITPSSEVKMKAKASDKNVYGFAYIQSEIDSALYLKWEIADKSLPDEWGAVFCDNVACFLQMPDNNQLDVIRKSDKVDDNLMRLMIEPFNKKGEGFVKLFIYENKNNWIKIDSIIYHIKVE